jgi:anaerobic dimethyl sulfoxide reductase subunit B
MPKKALFFDKDRCIGCYACVIACKLRHNAGPHPCSPPEGEPRGINPCNVYQFGPVMHGDRVVQFFQPVSCMHCPDAPCLEACPRGAIFRDEETGVVLVDQDRCIGCRFCLWVCPYGSPHFDEKGKMVKCDMCIDRIREGRPTACEAVCVARAIVVKSPEEIARIQTEKALARMRKGSLD